MNRASASPGHSANVSVVHVESGKSPTAGPGVPTVRTLPSPSRMTGKGWPPAASVTSVHPSPGSTMRYSSVAKPSPASAASTARLQCERTVAGQGSMAATARAVYRTRAVSAAASTPFPATSPMSAPHWVGGSPSAGGRGKMS